MRASEFINESKGKITKRQRYATRGLNVFSDGVPHSNDYTLNRVMMAAACSDGRDVNSVPQDSWVSKNNTAHPYTKEEQEMLKMAYKAVGAKWKDMNHGDMDSDELDSTNIQSPLKPFKGYKRK